MSVKKKKMAGQLAREEGTKNLKAKARLLKKFASNGVPWKRDEQGKYVYDENGKKLLEDVPLDATNFSRWKSLDVSRENLPENIDFKSNSRSTFYTEHNKDIHNEVNAYFSTLELLIKRTYEKNNKKTVIESLEVDVEYWASLANAQATTILDMVSKNNQLQIDYEKEKRDHRNNVNELSMQISDLESKLAGIAMVTPLKGIERGKK